MQQSQGDARWEDGALPVARRGRKDGGGFGQTAYVHRFEILMQNDMNIFTTKVKTEC